MNSAIRSARSGGVRARRVWSRPALRGLLWLGVLGGCGYRLAGLGGGLPGHIQVVAILPFDNESAFPEVEEGMTEQIIEGFNRRGRYQVQENEEGADAVMRAECGFLAGPARSGDGSGLDVSHHRARDSGVHGRRQ